MRLIFNILFLFLFVLSIFSCEYSSTTAPAIEVRSDRNCTTDCVQIDHNSSDTFVETAKQILVSLSRFPEIENGHARPSYVALLGTNAVVWVRPRDKYLSIGEASSEYRSHSIDIRGYATNKEANCSDIRYKELEIPLSSTERRLLFVVSAYCDMKYLGIDRYNFMDVNTLQRLDGTTFRILSRPADDISAELRISSIDGRFTYKEYSNVP